LRDQLRALARAAFEKQQALAEDEAVEKECLRVGLLGRKADARQSCPTFFSRAASLACGVSREARLPGTSARRRASRFSPGMTNSRIYFLFPTPWRFAGIPTTVSTMQAKSLL
jgi:hypothetical protein